MTCKKIAKMLSISAISFLTTTFARASTTDPGSVPIVAGVDRPIPKKFGDLDKFVQNQAVQLHREKSTSFDHRRELSTRVKAITGEIQKKMDAAEGGIRREWVDYAAFLKVQNALNELNAIANSLVGASDKKFYQEGQDALNFAINDLSESMTQLVLDVETRVYKEVGKRAVVVAFEGTQHNLTSSQMETIRKFYSSTPAGERIHKASIFAWSDRRDNPALADTRARKVQNFIRSFTDLQEIKLHNMEKDPTILERIYGIFGDKESDIKDAYFEGNADKDPLGWYLAQVSGQNRILIFLD